MTKRNHYIEATKYFNDNTSIVFAWDYDIRLSRKIDNPDFCSFRNYITIPASLINHWEAYLKGKLQKINNKDCWVDVDLINHCNPFFDNITPFDNYYRIRPNVDVAVTINGKTMKPCEFSAEEWARLHWDN